MGGAFVNNGQTCCAAKRVYIHESIYDDMTAELVKIAQETKIGDGFSDGVAHGPLNNKMQYDKVMSIIEDTKKQADAKIECGGKKADGHKGYFIEPTIVSGAKEGMRIVDEEQFGPVMPLLKYSDVDEALRRANDSPYGLGGSVWCKHGEEMKARKLACQIKAGTVWVNDHAALTGGPFGGFKESGIGRELGSSDIQTFSEVQTVFVPPKPKEPKALRDPSDPGSKKKYSKEQFNAFYGKKAGAKMWAAALKAAAPKKAKEPKKEKKSAEVVKE